MKKILVAALAAMVLAVSCDGTGSEEPEVKGSFVTDSGISVDLRSACDIYASTAMGFHAHALMFTSADGVSGVDYVPAEGERVDSFLLMLFSSSDELESGDIPPLSLDATAGMPELPGWMSVIAAGFVGTDDPDSPEPLYGLDGTPDDEGQPVLNVVRNGDMFEISFRDVILYDGEGNTVKGTLLYEGKIELIDGNGTDVDVQAGLMSLR